MCFCFAVLWGHGLSWPGSRVIAASGKESGSVSDVLALVESVNEGQVLILLYMFGEATQACVFLGREGLND